jgi:hypothetical protein
MARGQVSRPPAKDKSMRASVSLLKVSEIGRIACEEVSLAW